MTISEQKMIFAKNLMKYVERSGKQQKEIARELGYSYTTFNTWIRGSSMPNTAKIQAIADYFGILKSDLLDEKTEMEAEDKKYEWIAYIGMANKSLSFLMNCDPTELIASLIQLSPIGVSELQKRLDEMLCIQKYKKTLDIDSDEQFSSVSENGLITHDYLGRVIKKETPKPEVTS